MSETEFSQREEPAVDAEMHRKGYAVRGLGRRLHRFIFRPEASVIVVSAALVLYFELANQNFITGDNVETLSQFIAAPVIIASGEIMLLICREIDLSVGQVFALA